MITIFNRKELAITYSMKEQARIRDILTAEGIDYIIDTKGTVMRNMGARGPPYSSLARISLPAPNTESMF